MVVKVRSPADARYPPPTARLLAALVVNGNKLDVDRSRNDQTTNLRQVGINGFGRIGRIVMRNALVPATFCCSSFLLTTLQYRAWRCRSCCGQ